MTKENALNIISVKALSYGLDPDLIQSIVQIESDFNPWVYRFEPKWVLYHNPVNYAKKLGITLDTEKNSQAISFGLMQVMGAVARELGFDEELIKLCDPELAIQYGCLKLIDLKKRYTNEQDIISAYNAGSAYKINGKYKNQEYVDEVSGALLKLRSKS